MENKGARAIFLGVGIFLGFIVLKMISGKEIMTKETLLPAIVGSLVAALVVYFLGDWFANRRK